MSKAIVFFVWALFTLTAQTVSVPALAMSEALNGIEGDETSAPLIGMNRYFPGVIVHDDQLLPEVKDLLVRALEDLEPSRKPMAGADDTRYFRRIHFQMSETDQFTFEVTKFFPYEVPAKVDGRVFEGEIDFTVGIPVSVLALNTAAGQKNTAIKEIQASLGDLALAKPVRKELVNWYQKEWQCRMEQEKRITQRPPVQILLDKSKKQDCGDLKSGWF